MLAKISKLALEKNECQTKSMEFLERIISLKSHNELRLNIKKLEKR